MIDGATTIITWAVLDRSLSYPNLASSAAVEPLAAGAATVAVGVHEAFRKNYDRIWRLLRGLGVAQDRLDDAAQQVFLIYAERHADVVAGRETSFLIGTAIRTAHAERRAVSREVFTDFDAAHSSIPGVEDLTDQKRARLMLDLLLERMDPELRTIFVLFELEELTTPEIAVLVGVPLGTAASRLRRSREQFSALLKRHTAARASSSPRRP